MSCSTLPPLPYAHNALEPYISEQMLVVHYTKHHNAYSQKLAALMQEHSIPEPINLESLVRTAYKHSHWPQAVFNNAAQLWNHTFFWNSLSPQKTQPSPQLEEKILASFGSMQKFKELFTTAAQSVFGSGWTWLVCENHTLKIVNTSNADTPLTTPQSQPLITLDVWEHAYYIDYHNRRPDYIKAIVDNLLNWKFASDQLQL